MMIRSIKNYQFLHQSEEFGGQGSFGISIEVGGTNMPDFEADDAKAIRYAVYDAVRNISEEIKASRNAKNPECQKQKTYERNELIGCFPGKIFVEEIPNGYCHDACCRHLPWFIVTTEVGRFKIGWRKRVINIDWSETIGTEPSNSLFPEEDVTKGEKYIHAWSVEKAKEYIDKIIASRYL